MIVKGEEIIEKVLSKSDLSKKSLGDYIINVATGCLHGCTFCYVPSTPVIRMRKNTIADRGADSKNWGSYLFLRKDVPEKLEKTLAGKRTWNESPGGRGVVLLCSGTDPYQNPQAAKITRETVRVLLKYNKRVRILTRSPLWTRDLDILVHPNVTIGASLPSLNDDLVRQVEPKAPRPSDRLKALQKGQEAGARIFVAIAPTYPVQDKFAFEQLADVILPLNPEVCFWEPINARGENSSRMIQAGLNWTASVSEKQQWEDNFAKQYAEISPFFGEKLHPWFDANLSENCGISTSLIEEWKGKPTIERWESIKSAG